MERYPEYCGFGAVRYLGRCFQHLLHDLGLHFRHCAEHLERCTNCVPLEACGIDSKVYTGFALGMGVERITNLKYRVKDLRMFSENDVRFLEEFTAAH